MTDWDLKEAVLVEQVPGAVPARGTMEQKGHSVQHEDHRFWRVSVAPHLLQGTELQTRHFPHLGLHEGLQLHTGSQNYPDYNCPDNNSTVCLYTVQCYYCQLYTLK